MRRAPFILLAIAVLGATLSLGAYWLTGQFCARHLAGSTDDLAWLRMEFQLSDAEMARVRQLHDGYLPRCREYCTRIAATKRELQAALGTNGPVTGTVEQKLAAIGALRAQCQTAMLRHFAEVSAVMPPAQGHRYLAEMQRLTLGAHEQIEQSMAPAAPHAHH